MLTLLLLIFLVEAEAQDNRYGSYQKKKIFTFSVEGEAITVYMLLDKENKARYYTANLTGDVCLDELCKPINIDIYWDLLGNFHDYKTTDSNRLTKFDHVEFTSADHIKLREILADTTSLLKDYNVEDLIDTSVKVASLVKVDAVTGATNPTFEGAIVPGAVYTVYRLWHFVNVDLRKKIMEYSEKNLFTDAGIKELLLSGNERYQYFLINYIPQSKVQDFEEELLALIEDKDDYVPLHALSRLPDKLWHNAAFQLRISGRLTKLKHPARMFVLNKLAAMNQESNVLNLLMASVPEFSKEELGLTFKIFETNKEMIKLHLVPVLNQLKNGQRKDVREYTNDLLLQL